MFSASVWSAPALAWTEECGRHIVGERLQALAQGFVPFREFLEVFIDGHCCLQDKRKRNMVSADLWRCDIIIASL